MTIARDRRPIRSTVATTDDRVAAAKPLLEMRDYRQPRALA